MTVENKEAYIKYRIQRAEGTFEEALIMTKENRWNAVVNRLYYACFYAVIALLLKNDIEIKTHSGARMLFGENFVKTHKFSIIKAELYTKLFRLRQKGDYGDIFDFDDETVIPLIEPVKEFIEEIKKLIFENGK